MAFIIGPSPWKILEVGVDSINVEHKSRVNHRLGFFYCSYYFKGTDRRIDLSLFFCPSKKCIKLKLDSLKNLRKIKVTLLLPSSPVPHSTRSAAHPIRHWQQRIERILRHMAIHLTVVADRGSGFYLWLQVVDENPLRSCYSASDNQITVCSACAYPLNICCIRFNTQNGLCIKNGLF